MISHLCKYCLVSIHGKLGVLVFHQLRLIIMALCPQCRPEVAAYQLAIISRTYLARYFTQVQWSSSFKA